MFVLSKSLVYSLKRVLVLKTKTLVYLTLPKPTNSYHIFLQYLYCVCMSKVYVHSNAFAKCVHMLQYSTRQHGYRMFAVSGWPERYPWTAEGGCEGLAHVMALVYSIALFSTTHLLKNYKKEKLLCFILQKLCILRILYVKQNQQTLLR